MTRRVPTPFDETSIVVGCNPSEFLVAAKMLAELRRPPRHERLHAVESAAPAASSDLRS